MIFAILFQTHLTLLIVAATVVLSSTAGAAEWNGGWLGEFVKAGEHDRRPYYRQWDTQGNTDIFIFYNRNGEKWLVSDKLGDQYGALTNYKRSHLPPVDKWLFFDSKKNNGDDTSLTLEFTSLSPCNLVRVAGEGDVVKVHGNTTLGDYRSEYVLKILGCQVDIITLT